MQKTRIVVTTLFLLGALLIPWTYASAVTDGYYSLTDVTTAPPLWDGTDASRTKAQTADYNYTYGDEASLTYNLPWSFSFYGQSYSQINIDTNGNIWFGSTGSANSFNLANNNRGPVIAAWNNDLSSYYYGGAFVQHKTNPERVVIEWQTETYTDEGFNLPNNLEVVLYANGSIRLDYKTFNTSVGKDFNSGISKGDGTAFLNLTENYGNVFSIAGRSFSFNTYTPPLAITTTSLPDEYFAGHYNAQLGATGGTPPYTWSIISGVLPPYLVLDSSSGTITGHIVNIGIYPLTLQVADSSGTKATKVLTLNLYMFVSINTTSLPSGTVGVAYSKTMTVNGGKLPYTWSVTTGNLPSGLTLNATTGTISGTPTTSGSSNFTIQAIDINGNESSIDYTTNSFEAFKAMSIVVNDPVNIITNSLPSGTAGNVYNQTLAATGGVSRYTWSVSSGTLPDGLTLSASSGVISGIPTTAGTSNVTITATDANNIAATQPLTIIVYAALSVTTVSMPDAYVGTPYNQTLTATGGKTPYNWSITSGSLPAGLILNTSTGVITGTPTTAGTSSISVQVTDANMFTSSQTLTINVYAVPVVNTTSLPDSYVGNTYNQTLTNTGGKASFTWSINSGTLPTGLSLNTSTGAITGTPIAAGTVLTFKVKDANNITSVASSSITIAVGAALSITTASLPAGNVGSVYNQTVSATGGKTTYTWSIISGALPAGLSLNASTGIITGTPTTAGTSSFTVQVADVNAVTATKALSIAINNVPVISTVSLPDGYLNTVYSQTLAVTGGKSPYTWSITSGTLPTGLSLNVSTGVVSGKPTATGSKTLTFQVKDASNTTATKSLTITIYALPSISTTTLANGTIGTLYSQTMAATGGKTAYTWSITNGTLPAGLSLNASTGAITGTPTTAGTSNCTFQVADANGKTASKVLSITIVAPVVTQLNAWTNLYSAAPNNTSATNLATGSSFTVGSGTNRLLLVAVVMEIGTAANPTISASYGGTALTQINVTANTQREIVWMGYLKESQIGSGSKALTITYSGATGNASALHVKWASFTGVNQTTPIASSGGVNTATTSATFDSTINYVNNGMTTVVAGNGGTPATGTLSATPAFIAGTATTTNAQTSRTFTTAKHTATGSYASTTPVTWTGTTSNWSGLVAVSLQP